MWSYELVTKAYDGTVTTEENCLGCIVMICEGNNHAPISDVINRTRSELWTKNGKPDVKT